MNNPSATFPLPSFEDLAERAHVVSLPMHTTFRGINTREALLLEGPAGWGEFSPFVEYEPTEAASWLASGIEAAWQGLPSPVRDKVAINATVPAVAASEVERILERTPGVNAVKVKVAEPGQSLDDDISRVSAVRELMPQARIRVDANGGWSVDEAFQAATALAPLDYMEQPCASVEELAELRMKLQRSGIFVRVAADESIRRAADPFRVAQLRAADVAVVKVAPLGGVSRTLDIASHLRENFMDITVASALDTAVGINAGIAAVAALPRISDDDGLDVPPAAAGLGTSSLFVEDVALPRPLIDGFLPATPVTPTADRLSELAAPGHRRDWWLERLQQCWQVLYASNS